MRDVTDADLDAVVGLFLQYLAFYEHAADEQRVREFLTARFASDDTLLLVAEVTPGGAVVGLAQAYQSWSSVSLGPVWVLNDLFVDPSARGSGAGRALVREICDRAKEAGAIRVSLATAWDNVAAQGLYESEGFARDVSFLHYAKVTGG
ncbi:GNAT family N-acetyltransferase [Myceligenerans sp. I2]|uniref:GNAT family N-acetyltransferase n=1 Tax=Myceligenerans indicum TaxID=2593663 RepID=A0ABS1LSZ9_9MICO|nr:GNAT family N-acetyltransferase [Myceligenerans indicum]